MELVVALGHSVTHDWTRRAPDPDWPIHERQQYLRECGYADYQGVLECDVLVLVNHNDSRDSLAEFGIALGLGKRVIVYRPERRRGVFFHLVEQVSTLGALAALLRGAGADA